MTNILNPYRFAVAGGVSFSDDFTTGTDNILDAYSSNWTHYTNGTTDWWVDAGNDDCSLGDTGPYGQDMGNPDRFETVTGIYSGTQCSTVKHFAVEKYVSINLSASCGLVLRSTNVGGENCYHVNLLPSSSEIKWEVVTNAGTFQETVQTISSVTFTTGRWYGARISGTGASTVIEVFEWTSDPGESPDFSTVWQTLSNNPTNECNTGKYVGIRGYSGVSAGAYIVIDDFRGGDWS